MGIFSEIKKLTRPYDDDDDEFDKIADIFEDELMTLEYDDEENEEE